MDLQAIDTIIKRCNRIDKKIGARKNETLDSTVGVSILTTGQYIVKISFEEIERQSGGTLGRKISG